MHVMNISCAGFRPNWRPWRQCSGIRVIRNTTARRSPRHVDCRASDGTPDRQAEVVRRAAELRRQQQQIEQEMQLLQQSLDSLPEAERVAGLEELASLLPPGKQEQPSPAAAAAAAQSTSPPEPPTSTPSTAGPAGADVAAPAADAGAGSGGELGGVPRELQQALEQVGLWDPQLATEAALALPKGLPPYADGALHEEDEEYVDGDEADIEVDEGVDEWARIIEEGGRLPPIPEDLLLCKPEPLEQFRDRIQASIDAYEAGVTVGPDGREPGLPPPGENPFGDDVMNEDWSGPFHKVPIMPEEIRGVIPAPEPPEEIMDQYRRMERILLVLRRAFLTQRPTEWVQSLESKGLLAEKPLFQDPWVGLWGVPELRRYMQQLEDSGCKFELYKPIARCLEYDPIPKWEIIIDAWLHVPIPHWYWRYQVLHPELTQPRQQQEGEQHQQGRAEGRRVAAGQQQQAGGERGEGRLAGGVEGWEGDPGRQQRQEEYATRGLVAEDDWLVGVNEHGEFPGRLYPRVRDPPPPSSRTPPGRAHLRWFPAPAAPPAAAPLLLWVPNALSQFKVEQQPREQARQLGVGEQAEVDAGWWDGRPWLELGREGLQREEGDDYDAESSDESEEESEEEWVEMDVTYVEEGSQAERFRRFPTLASLSFSRSRAGGGSSASSGGSGSGSGSSLAAAQQADYSMLEPHLLLADDWAGTLAVAVVEKAAPQVQQQQGGQGRQQQQQGGAEEQRGPQQRSSSSSSDTSFGGRGWEPLGAGSGIEFEVDKEDDEGFEDRPLTKREAEGLLRELLGDEFDNVMARMPSYEKRTGKAVTEVKPGEAYKQGDVITFTWTFAVNIDTVLGKVLSSRCTWGAVRGVLPSIRDAMEVFVAAARLDPLPRGRHMLRDEGAGGQEGEQ